MNVAAATGERVTKDEERDVGVCDETWVWGVLPKAKVAAERRRRMSGGDGGDDDDDDDDDGDDDAPPRRRLRAMGTP